MWPLAVIAEPGVHDLVATCERALAQGYRGVDAAACDWYVVPCGVCGAAAAAPRWCLPPDMPSATIAAQLIEALRDQNVSSTAPAEEAVDRFLSARYPCSRPANP